MGTQVVHRVCTAESFTPTHGRSVDVWVGSVCVGIALKSQVGCRTTTARSLRDAIKLFFLNDDHAMRVRHSIRTNGRPARLLCDGVQRSNFDPVRSSKKTRGCIPAARHRGCVHRVDACVCMTIQQWKRGKHHRAHPACSQIASTSVLCPVKSRRPFANEIASGSKATMSISCPADLTSASRGGREVGSRRI
jgi:hypothetical protein